VCESIALMHSFGFVIVILSVPYGTDLPGHMSGADNAAVI